MNENAKPDLADTAALLLDKADPLATPASVSQRDDARSQQPLGREALDVFVAWSIIGIFLIVSMAVIHELSMILMPVVMAVVVGMILGVSAEKLASYGIPGAGVAIILSTLVAAVIFFVVNSLVDPVSQLASEGPALIERTIDRFLPYFENMRWLNISAATFSMGSMSMESLLSRSGEIISLLGANVTPAIVQGLIFLAALLMFLYSRLRLRKALIMAFPARHQRLRTIRIIGSVEKVLGTYFATASLIYAALGVTMIVIAYLGGLSMPLLWGLFAFLSSFVPFLGITLMTISLTVAGIITHDNMVLALLPAGAFFTIHLLMENLAFPAVVGRNMEINPFLVFVMIIFWTWMWGAAGAMLALPLSLIAMTVTRELFPTRRVVPNLPD
ncbi:MULTISPECIES: AI-2E family transporter [Agrobacterium]|jgi:predicted PurR-regulated permease PerM|uniref:AI-2E family transporter n=1 Tax=Agrobacterium salinitolerans TaxID=1183413 RepID=A0A9X3KR14_9HYPH|nr:MULTISPECIES: AI-2E family transporter [Agrobacterium]PNQ25207.1 AI-2E family transporter [Rhizobium sp. YIC5082]MCZ7854503.1 AI-2E family transporter [Agrobacterium salinitolerans]MCZ7860255.1 AI-2E family transporter [Agrobacterium salinitolerans]MCZ7893497.1 AI-2E family transporter [Agrobacterium salinitolerans]MCZ7939375.1 AI-2E family transporter [Agrobacterium salinitolerans]